MDRRRREAAIGGWRRARHRSPQGGAFAAMPQRLLHTEAPARITVGMAVIRDARDGTRVEAVGTGRDAQHHRSITRILHAGVNA